MSAVPLLASLAIFALAPSACGQGPAADDRRIAPLEHRVIVDLAVEWRPEHRLSAAARNAQRRRIEAAQAKLLRALGRHGRLRRELHATAQLALAVDDAGLALLRRHRLVAAVHTDSLDAPG